MNICIIGSGVSGLMSACAIKDINFIKKITIIGSSKISPIKVGESTTQPFFDFIQTYFDTNKFVKKTDATVKYGVFYENWSKKNYIHYFGSNEPFLRKQHLEKTYCEMLANKDPKIHIHDLMGNKLWNFIQKNEVSLNLLEHPHSWHFDAGKFKLFLKEELVKDPKITFIDDKIIDCCFSGSNINFIVGESNKIYDADYFINCCGDHKINEKTFKEKYVSLSSYLLTNKALVYPLKYTNKKNQFHPYTVAKTMKHGWRWITPTQSRIGTGYVFSDNHISIDEATNEFLEDVGDKTIQPFLVDFNPKYNESPFKINSCTIGMSSGFLEPLDAPGLAFTIFQINNLSKILKMKNESKDKNFLNEYNKKLNMRYFLDIQWWCSFILHQYKTSTRNDTQFWIDQKNVKCYFYDQIINSIEFLPSHLLENHEYEMFFKTTAGKDITWNSNIKTIPFVINEIETKTVHHLNYIDNFYNN